MSGYTRTAGGLLFDSNNKLAGFIASDGKEQLLSDAGAIGTVPSEEVVIFGASSEGRAHCLQSITSSTISTTAATGQVSLRTSSAYPMRAGHTFRLASLPHAEIEGIYQVVSAVAEAGGTRVIGNIQDGLTLPDIAAGTLTGTSYDLHDMQARSSTAGWPSLLEGLMGGRIRCTVLGTGGSSVDDWLDPNRVRQVVAMANRAGGKLGALIVGAGIVGNSINGALQSGDAVLGYLRRIVSIYSPLARVIYISQPAVPTNQNLTNNTTLIQANTAKFAAAARVLAGIDDIARTSPNVRVVPLTGAEVTNYGASNTTDVVNGFAPIKFKADDGLHNVWGGCQVAAAAFALVMRTDFPPRFTTNAMAPGNVITSFTADSSGKFVQNLAEGFFGAVAQTANIPNSCSAATTLPGTTVITPVVRTNFDAGSDWMVTITRGSNNAVSGSIASMIYTGTANSLLTQMNLARNQGVDIDSWVPCGVYGFNEDCGALIEVVLEVDDGDGNGYLPISAAFAAQGQFTAASMTYTDSSKPGMPWGFNLPLRLPRFKIPVGKVYTAARVRFTWKPKNGTNWGSATMRLGAGMTIKPLN